MYIPYSFLFYSIIDTVLILPLQFVQFINLDASYITVDIDHNRDSYCRFGCRDGDGEQGKEIPFQSVGEKETVEYCEVDIRSIQYQLDADKYRQCVAAGEERCV